MPVTAGANTSASWTVSTDVLIFCLSGAMIFLIFTLGSPLLNLLIPYSQPGGSFFAKFHPASWLVAPLLILVMQKRSLVAGPHIACAAALTTLLIAWLALRGKGALAATLVDIQLVPLILLLAFLRLPLDAVRTLLQLFVLIAAINAFIVGTEFALRSPLLSREGYEQFFRPAGLFAHPIVAGTLFYSAMFLCSRGVVSASHMRPLMLLFLLATALCGVRGPLAMACLIFLLNVVHPAIPRRGAFDYALDFGVVAVLPIAILVTYYSGAFDRVLTLGLWEESAQSRFLIFNALDLLTENEFWWGLGGYDVGEHLALETTGGRLIESAFVIILFQGGLPAALIVCASLTVLHGPAMRQSVVFFIMIALVALTTLGFSVKCMIAPALTLVSFWVWRQSFELPRWSWHFGSRAAFPDSRP